MAPSEHWLRCGTEKGRKTLIILETIKPISIFFNIFVCVCETNLSFEGRTPFFLKEKNSCILEINTEIAKLFRNILFKDQMEMAHNESL